jgi:hypothetical protein
MSASGTIESGEADIERILQAKAVAGQMSDIELFDRTERRRLRIAYTLARTRTSVHCRTAHVTRHSSLVTWQPYPNDCCGPKRWLE